jgi:kinesin family protein 20/centromeric protein E
MFSKRVKQVKNKARINEDDSGNLESLKNEIKRLKMELAKKTVMDNWETPKKVEPSLI